MKVDLPKIETIEECLFMDCQSLEGINTKLNHDDQEMGVFPMYIVEENCNS